MVTSNILRNGTKTSQAEAVPAQNLKKAQGIRFTMTLHARFVHNEGLRCGPGREIHPFGPAAHETNAVYDEAKSVNRRQTGETDSSADFGR
jgi:hypothetical protein